MSRGVWDWLGTWGDESGCRKTPDLCSMVDTVKDALEFVSHKVSHGVQIREGWGIHALSDTTKNFPTAPLTASGTMLVGISCFRRCR
ncbi:hypothetical protein Sjap_025847 [Stephania japonica]|uniref:Uncharacterized protein n=1 Tax=Stephania japonica TaxID=461633 RepID=A0AAP0E2I3_9MAGN